MPSNDALNPSTPSSSAVPLSDANTSADANGAERLIKPSAKPSDKPRREIKSFVVRSARMTESQQKAFDGHMKKWALASNEKLDWHSVFNNSNPVTLEIGFGMGDSLAQMAQNNPEHNFLGIEVHQAGIGRLLSLVEKHALNNVRVISHDAVEVLKKQVEDNSLARVNIYFPDPWHKKRHHKRRLIQSDFIALLAQKIMPDGLLHIATDWEPYTQHILDVINRQNDFINIASDSVFSDASTLGRPETKFERRGIRLGHGVWDIAFKRS